jgi:hypothetical protein
MERTMPRRTLRLGRGRGSRLRPLRCGWSGACGRWARRREGERRRPGNPPARQERRLAHANGVRSRRDRRDIGSVPRRHDPGPAPAVKVFLPGRVAARVEARRGLGGGENPRVGREMSIDPVANPVRLSPSREVEVHDLPLGVDSGVRPPCRDGPDPLSGETAEGLLEDCLDRPRRVLLVCQPGSPFRCREIGPVPGHREALERRSRGAESGGNPREGARRRGTAGEDDTAGKARHWIEEGVGGAGSKLRRGRVRCASSPRRKDPQEVPRIERRR